MNKKLYIWIVFVLGLFSFVSCIDDSIEATKQESDPAYLSASEAQAFFESSFTTGHTRSVSGKKDKGRLDPGEFTPQWKRAQTSQNKGVGSVDIPLLAGYRYKAIRCEFKNGTSKAYAVDVTQKLIVLKSKHTEAKVQYLLTLIPDKDYYRKNKGDLSDKFIHAGEKSGYSGLAVYTHAVTGKIISVGKYEAGNLITNVYLLSGKGTIDSRIKKANELLDGIKMPRMKSLTTRSLGEGDTEVFLCSICGTDAASCDCWWDKPADCLCGNCELCGWECPWCGNNPCTCNDDLYCPMCGFINCTCDEPNETEECLYCGNINCKGECQDSSCGNCGNCPECGYNTEQEEPKIKAKDLFRNRNMTETNWELLDNMLLKIMEECLGEALVAGLDNLLNGGTLSIQFSNNSGGGFHFDGSTAGITLGVESAESNVLFHEMWHAYQAYQNMQASYTNSLMNQEIEAHYAQYIYLKNLPEYNGSKWEQGYKNDERLLGVAEIEEFINAKGGLLNSANSVLFDTYIEFTVVTSFRNTPGYENYKYDDKRSGLANFPNLRILIKDC